MDYQELFWRAWQQLLLALPHDRQTEVMTNPGGFEWRQLTALAAQLAE